ncbi:MAG TPA: M20/M25/M40 family metallo-hydrolase [Terriglobales bacterium]|nr:M20/M25/M40 family metallo-hydrolase [Terriglobales bacterium]
MKRLYFRSVVVAAALLLCLIASAADRTEEQKTSYRKAMEVADQKIADEVKAHSELMKNLEYLTTQIGPRLTGSPQMQKASDWTLQRFKEYGIAAHLETTEIPQGWTRGKDQAEIVAPVSRQIEIRAMGWSKSTNGAVTGPVLLVKAKKMSDLGAYKRKIKGAIVLREPVELPSANEVPENAYDAVIAPARGVQEGPEAGWSERRKLLNAIAAEGPAVILLDSGKTDSLFSMSSLSRYRPSDAPLGFLTHEDYSLIYRLSQAGPVTMKVNLSGTFSAGPVPASITIAEIQGSQFPNERVIIGGHLDSWDLGQGALDNGTGAMAVIEAARTLKALGWQPRRTLTFILFTGEEQGSIGADLYLDKHTAEIPQMDGVLILDTGTGKVFSIALENLYQTAPLMAEIYTPLKEIFDLEPLSTRYFGASDHVPFLNKGVPAYFCVQRVAKYGEAHHSQTDTFDKVIPDEINEGAALLAAWMWNVSEMPEALPHHATNTEFED